MNNTVNYIKGDLFRLTKTPSKTPILLAHACNCMGVWGGGIAFAFKQRFQSAYKLYHSYCKERNPEQLLGKSLLLGVSKRDSGFVKGACENVIIVCLFTSIRGNEGPEKIATYTQMAMKDLRAQLNNPKLIYNEEARKIIESSPKTPAKLTINMPKINAGIFAVPWELTESALKESGLNCSVFVLN